MILSAQSILRRNIIKPTVSRTVVNGKTYGLSAAGYDVRVDFTGLENSFKVLRKFDPRKLASPYLFGYPDDSLDSDFFLAGTIEHFTMPNDVLGVVHDKSSWARRGVAVQNTVIEPGWRGYLTLEIAYHGPMSEEVVIHHGDPIAQVVFHKLDAETILPYNGKYQDQKRGAQPAIDEKD